MLTKGMDSGLTAGDVLKALAALAMIVTLALLASGCTGANTVQTSSPAILTQKSPVSYLPPVQRRHHGSLWGAGRRLRLYDDLRAREVGDIVTVSVVENAQANKKATTQSDREQELSAGLDSIFGFKWTAQGLVPTSSGESAANLLKTKFNNKFKGTGKTDRSDTMSASIACRVVQVLPSGNLYIKGSRLVQVNFEQQTITLEGVIRPADISPQNIVLSTHVADAKITYSGTGPVSDKQRPGWLSRLLDIVWPF